MYAELPVGRVGRLHVVVLDRQAAQHGEAAAEFELLQDLLDARAEGRQRKIGLPELEVPQPAAADGRQRIVDLAKILRGQARSEEHTSELQSLMRRSYAVFSLIKQKVNIVTE